MSISEKAIMDAVNQSLANFGSPSKLLIDPNLLKSYLKLMQGEFADTVYCDYNLTKSMQIFARFNVLLTKLGFVEPNEQVELREVVLHKTPNIRKRARSRIRRREKSKGNK